MQEQEQLEHTPAPKLALLMINQYIHIAIAILHHQTSLQLRDIPGIILILTSRFIYGHIEPGETMLL